MIPRGARYRIQAVSEMTGIPAATLRAWERRYGVPSPERTASAYRLYSDEDIRVIRRMRELCDDGMSPAEAARSAQRLPVAGELAALDPHERITRTLVEAVREFDLGALEEALDRATYLGSARSIFTKILAPAMSEIGELWHAGTISVAQEHMTSELMVRTARDLLRVVSPDPPEGSALLACFADEDHLFPLYGPAFSVVRWRLRPVILGARTPPAALGDAVAAMGPALVGLSATIEMPGHRARELVASYAKACGGTPWVVGGAQHAALAELVREAGGEVGDLEAFERLLGEVARGSGFKPHSS